MDGGSARYEHVQRIAIDVPIRVEITSVTASGELVLFALTESVLRPMVVYKYAGVMFFRPFFEAVTLPPAREFRLLGQRAAADSARGEDLVAVLGADGSVHVIESVLD